MRVLLSGYVCDPDAGSEAANTWFTARELVLAGAEVTLLTREATLTAAPGMRIHTLADDVPSWVPSGLRTYARYAAFQRSVRRFVARRSASWDVTHHISWGSITHPVGLAGIDLPLIVGPVGGGQPLRRELAQYVDGALGSNRLRNVVVGRGSMLNPLVRHSARSTDVLLVTNDETATMAHRTGFERVEPMLAEGVRALPAGGAERDPGLVVWIGRFLPIKAAGLALSAFRHLVEREPRARLEFIGDGPTRAQVQAKAADLEAAGLVRFSGRLDWAKAQQRLSRAAVHLFTSVRDSSSAQALEAAALGVPTVALNLSGMRMLWEAPAARLVEPLPADSLPNRLADALQESLTCDVRAGAATRQFASQFTFSRRARQLLELYSEVA